MISAFITTNLTTVTSKWLKFYRLLREGHVKSCFEVTLLFACQNHLNQTHFASNSLPAKSSSHLLNPVYGLREEQRTHLPGGISTQEVQQAAQNTS